MHLITPTKHSSIEKIGYKHWIFLDYNHRNNPLQVFILDIKILPIDHGKDIRQACQ